MNEIRYFDNKEICESDMDWQEEMRTNMTNQSRSSGARCMDSNLQVYVTQVICHWLHEKYGYSEKECQAYIKGYEDATTFMDKQIKPCSVEEYFNIIIESDTMSDIVEGRGLKPLSPTE